jgi:hypothetical protein
VKPWPSAWKPGSVSSVGRKKLTEKYDETPRLTPGRACQFASTPTVSSKVHRLSPTTSLLPS